MRGAGAGGRNCQRASPGDAGVVSQPPEQLGKMIGVIVVACAAIGLPVSEAKIKIMHLR